MALDKSGLKAAILSLVTNLFNDTIQTPEDARETFATGLSDAIDVFVKTGTATVNGSGLTAGSNPVTGLTTTSNIS